MDELRTAEQIMADFRRQEENRKMGETYEILFSCPYRKTCPAWLMYRHMYDGMDYSDCIRRMYKLGGCPRGMT